MSFYCLLLFLLYEDNSLLCTIFRISCEASQSSATLFIRKSRDTNTEFSISDDRIKLIASSVNSFPDASNVVNVSERRKSVLNAFAVSNPSELLPNN